MQHTNTGQLILKGEYMNEMKLKLGKKSGGRRYSGRGPRPDLYELRKKEALERNSEWAKLTPLQQLSALDTRLGKDTGAKRQRTRIATLLSSANAKNASVAGAPVQAAQESSEKLKSKDRRELERDRARKATK